ncbi:MAG: hypothetical protein ACR2LH_07115 [Thermoleophilaceae bacterium]
MSLPRPVPDRGREIDPWRFNEVVRIRRLREQARRPLAVNLAEGIALSELLATFRGAARR